MFSPFEGIVPANCHGLRLDQALVRMIPGMGRRGVRLFWTHGEVRVDGRRQAAGFRVQTGQHVQVDPPPGLCDTPQEMRPSGLFIPIAGQSGSFAALVKPAGMHCENLAGSTGPCVEGALPALFPALFPGRSVRLLNRLDRTVSGLVLVALDDRAARDYAAWQDRGLVRKQYMAVVVGHVSGEIVLKAALDTAKRRKVRVLNVQEADALRWTAVRPLSYDAEKNETLLQVEILKGRRHQIRAHLAAMGHPVVQDALYGSGSDQGWICLHHHAVTLPGFSVRADPGWPGWRVECGSPPS